MLYPAELPGHRQPTGAVWTKAPRAGKTFIMELRAVHAPPPRFRAVRLARALVLALVAAASSARAACGTPDGTVRIAGVDARLDFVLSDGRTVRLGGVASPDPGRAPDLAGAARDFLERRFVGRDGELERLASETDRWGRVVADIVVSEPTDPDRKISVASALLAAGYARVAPAVEARGCVAARLSIEDEARRAGLGLWADPRYAVIAATDVEALRASDGTTGRDRRRGAEGLASAARASILTSLQRAARRSSSRESSSRLLREPGIPSTLRPVRRSVRGGRSTTVWVRDSRSASRR